MHYRVGDYIESRWEVLFATGGGFGRVYLVLDHHEDVPLAIKTFLTESPDVVQRFEVEASLWNQLDKHAHIVALDRFKVINGQPFLFLELVDGGDLSHWIGSERLTLSMSLLFSLQFCDGITHAYAKGLKAHRDIKPHNCLLTGSGDCLKITDFGLAKVIDQGPRTNDEAFSRWLGELLTGKTEAPPPAEPTLTQAGTALGTGAYMPPEQWHDAASADEKSDVYSFGVMLHQMLTGQLPFDADTTLTLAYHHCCVPPPALRLEHPLNGELDALVRACLAKASPDRPRFAELRPRLAELYKRATGEPAPEPVRGEELSARELSNKAACLINLEKLEQGLAMVDRALAMRDLDYAWVNRALCLRKLGRLGEAVESCDCALRRRQSSQAWSELGMSLALLNDERAESCLRRALELNRHDPLAWYNLGLFQSGKGRLEEGIFSFRKALMLQPLRGELHVGYGMALYNMGQLEEAAACFRKCLKFHPHNARAWQYLGNAVWDLGRRGEAQPCFERALEEDPRAGGAWLGLARCYVNDRRYEEALPLLQRALQFEPKEPLAWHVLGTTNVMLGRNEEAARALERAVELDEQDAEGWFILGQLQIHARQVQAAYQSLQKATLLGHAGAAQLLTQFR